MLYVSHRLEEVFEIADRITVMRNGRQVLTKDRTVLTIAQVIEGMIGRHQDELFPPPLAPSGAAAGSLAVHGLSVGRALSDVSFEVRAGEIVGLAGVDANGQSELIEVLTGLRSPTAGTVKVAGKDVTGASPREVQDAGLEVQHEENIRVHYAKTLAAWCHNLEENWDAAVAEVGEQTARVWGLYMAGSRLAFERNEIQLHHVLATKTDDDGVSGYPLRHTF